jgi:hypothetical protein
MYLRSRFIINNILLDKSFISMNLRSCVWRVGTVLSWAYVRYCTIFTLAPTLLENVNTYGYFYADLWGLNAFGMFEVTGLCNLSKCKPIILWWEDINILRRLNTTLKLHSKLSSSSNMVASVRELKVATEQKTCWMLEILKFDVFYVGFTAIHYRRIYQADIKFIMYYKLYNVK